MSKVLVSENNLSAIADSIRAKNGTQETYTPGEMSVAIDNLPSGVTSFGITEGDYLFQQNRRLDVIDELCALCDGTITSANSMFSNSSQLTSVPLFDTSKCFDMRSMFANTKIVTLPAFDMSASGLKCSFFCQNCSLLENVPVLHFGSVNTSYISSLFANCPSLTSESLNNIMASLLTMQGLRDSDKVLSYRTSFSQAQLETCQTLSNWGALEEAGWVVNR